MQWPGYKWRHISVVSTWLFRLNGECYVRRCSGHWCPALTSSPHLMMFWHWLKMSKARARPGGCDTTERITRARAHSNALTRTAGARSQGERWPLLVYYLWLCRGSWAQSARPRTVPHRIGSFRFCRHQASLGIPVRRIKQTSCLWSPWHLSQA